MKTHVLEIEEISDFHLYGMVTTAAPSRLAWDINNFHQTDLERVDDLETKIDGDLSYVAVLSDVNRESSHEILLIKNKSTIGHWIKEYKQFDYFLVERSMYGHFRLDLDKLKSSGLANYIVELEASLFYEHLADVFIL